MPYVKQAVIDRVTLNSDPTYFVMWRRSLTYGQMRDIARTGQQKGADGSTELDNLSAADALLLCHIQSWNLDDEAGNPLPLTPAGLAYLDEVDATQLSSLANTSLQKQETGRKN